MKKTRRFEQVIEVAILVVAFFAGVLLLWMVGKIVWAELDAPAETPAETRAPAVAELSDAADDPERVYRHDFAFEHKGEINTMATGTSQNACEPLLGFCEIESMGASPELYRQLEDVCTYFEGLRLEDEITEPPTLVYLGEWFLTGYDLCESCCGKTDGVTASGAAATVGRTVSVGEGALEFGTVLWIPGVGERVVEDGGGLGVKEMDVLCASHAECYALTGWYRVYRVMEP